MWLRIIGDILFFFKINAEPHYKNYLTEVVLMMGFSIYLNKE